MKNNIDLTERRDFDPDKFKIKKVQSTYYNSNGDESRLPWNKSGGLYSHHKLSYVFYNNDFMYIQSTNPNNISYIYNYNPVHFSEFNQSFTITYTNTTSTTYNMSDIYGSLDTSYTPPAHTYKPVLFDMDRNHPKAIVGKVADIRQRICCCEYYNRKYKMYTDNLKRDIHVEKSNKHRLYNMIHTSYNRYVHWITGTSFDFRYDMDNLYGYENVGEYINSKNRYGVDGMTLGDILNPIPRMVPCLYAKHNSTHGEDKGIKWPNFHEDYIREMEGLEPRADWRRGIETKKSSFRRRLFNRHPDAYTLVV